MNTTSRKLLVVVLLALLLVATLALAACDLTFGSDGSLSVKVDDTKVIYEDDDLETVKSYLIVTYTDAQGRATTITDYSLTGTLAVGQCSLTISYNQFTIDVVVDVVVRSTHCNHVFSDWQEITPSTCTEQGEKQRTCSLCGAIESQPIEALEHDFVPYEAKDATCTEIGWEAYETCSRCDYTTYAEIAVTGHALEHVYAKSSTCTEQGNVEHWHCEKCQKNFEDESAKNELESVTTPKGEHNYIEGFCEACGAKLTSKGLSYTLSSDKTYYFVSGIGTCTDTDIIIAATHNDLPVKSIGGSAFRGCSSLTSIEIPSSVTSIYEYAFYNCSSLTAVYITDIAAWCNIEFGNYLSSNPLRYAHNLYLNGELVTELEIPSTVTEINQYAFSDCSSLTSIKIPSSVTSIGCYAFRDCSGLTSIEIPLSVTVIEDNAFWGCNYLIAWCEAKSKPMGWESYWTFLNCPVVWDCKNNIVANDGNVYAVVGGVRYKIKDGVATVIKQRNNLNVAAIADTVVINSQSYPVISIGSSAFAYCSNLTNVTFGENSQLESIGHNAFSGCSRLTSIEIPSSVTSIGEYAFSGCSSLTIYCEAESQPSGWNSNWYDWEECPVVWDCNNNEVADDGNIYAVIDGIRYALKDDVATVVRQLSNIVSANIPSSVTYKETVYSVTSIGFGAFYNCSSLTSVTFGENSQLTSIDGGAFSSCSNLTSIEIPSSVTSIGDFAFEYCNSLTAVHITDIAAWCNIEFGDYSSNPLCYAHKLYLNGKLVTELEIPSTVTEIKNCAFCGGSLTSVTFGENSQLTSIGDAAFSGCSSLTSIEIPSSVTSIDGGAFSGCSNLTSIEIPSTVTSIGSYAFEYCSSLESIEIPSSVTSIDYRAFYGCSSLESITVAEGNTVYHSGGNCLIETATKTLIAGCKNSVIPTESSVTSIGYGAFYGCSDLKNITIPSSVTSIGEFAFYNCSSLTSIEIPSSVKSIGEFAFKECDSLTNIIIPDGVTSIGREVFCYCDSLTSIEIPGSVKSIGLQAFYGCGSLTNIVIPSTVTSISYYAFDPCSSLTIHCEAESKPSGWDPDWSKDSSGNACPVVWDCNNNEVADDGNIYTVIDGIRYALKDGVATVVRQQSNIVSANILSLVTYKGTSYSVTSIGEDAFSWCSSLISIEIPDSVTSIGEFAFHGCSNLATINFTGTEEQWNAIDKGSSWDHNTGNYTINYNYVAE